MNYPPERFRAYIASFNAGDFAALREFYAPDVHLTIGNGTVLVGKDAIVDFYRGVRSNTRRTIGVLRLATTEHLVAAELESEFLALEDAPDFTSGPMSAGDRLYINSFAFYEIENGLFSRVRAAVFRREWKRAHDEPTGAR